MITKKKYTRWKSSTIPSMKKAKTKSRKSVKGVLHPKNTTFVHQQIGSSGKELESKIEKGGVSLEMKSTSYVTDEICELSVDVTIPKGLEGKLGKRVTREPITLVLNVNQENVPWVTHMSSNSFRTVKPTGELLKVFNAALVERVVTANEDKRIRELFRKFQKLGAQELFTTLHGVPMYIKDVLCLSPRGRLSGEVLSVYGAIIKQMTARQSSSGNPTIHIEDTFFMNFLLSYYSGYCAGTADDCSDSRHAKIVRKRLNSTYLGYNPAEMLILIPINHENEHWTLAVVDPTDATIYMLDSIYSGDVLQTIYAKQIMVMQTMLPVALCDGTKGGDTPVKKIWKAFCVDDIPRQKNTFDCGVFIIAYMDMIARGRTIHFKSNLSNTKRVICRDILLAADAL